MDPKERKSWKPGPSASNNKTDNLSSENLSLQSFSSENLSSDHSDQNSLQISAQYLDQDTQSSPLSQGSPSYCGDESEVQELWQEVREFCTSNEIQPEFAPQSLYSSEMPSQLPPMPPIILSECLRNNNVHVLPVGMCEYMTPDEHFGKVGTVMRYIDVEVARQGLRSERGSREAVRLLIDQVFFDKPKRSAYKRVDDAKLWTGEISLEPEPVLVKRGQQHVQPEEKAHIQAQSAGGTSMPPPTALDTATFLRNKPAVSRATTKSVKPTLLRKKPAPSRAPNHDNSQTGKSPASHPPNAPTENLLYEFDIAEQTSAFLQELLPHTTFWLDRPRTTLIQVSENGVDGLEASRMFPYLTVVWQEEHEPFQHCHTRGSMIAACILSSHAKMLRMTPGAQQLSDLRHYIIVMEDNGLWFNVLQAKLKDEGSGCVVSWLDSGILPLHLGLFGSWVKNIHDWALTVWKPMILAAYSPEYLTCRGRSDFHEHDAENEAYAATSKWGEEDFTWTG
ncbi:hypothetical protein A1O3_10119 [Capronia epimyces CBS 606.96]|uniref:Uncharacterized protein n=1 Tax=Capronia epimyces CBS 606.96 TaxID=1182542 RepID=W9X922_9EURO|nr:uncharacterized protein A1O3_10119 [Capronia epimyces CBS 606.96]EXJ76962.1 hypothetical protein A1O3_10119 [Capronia epimyces CBS 606.96]